MHQLTFTNSTTWKNGSLYSGYFFLKSLKAKVNINARWQRSSYPTSANKPSTYIFIDNQSYLIFTSTLLDLKVRSY